MSSLHKRLTPPRVVRLKLGNLVVASPEKTLMYTAGALLVRHVKISVISSDHYQKSSELYK
jgi:hypothetical protein